MKQNMAFIQSLAGAIACALVAFRHPMKRWLCTVLLRWLGLADVEVRLKDLERHFIVERDQTGMPTKTLADIPADKRKDLGKRNSAGMSWPQRRAWLEATDGGRRAPIEERFASNS